MIGHKELDLEKFYSQVLNTVKQESKLYGIEEPSVEQIMLVTSALRDHTLLMTASTYDRSELENQNEEIIFCPVESSISRYFRDIFREYLDTKQAAEQAQKKLEKEFK